MIEKWASILTSDDKYEKFLLGDSFQSEVIGMGYSFTVGLSALFKTKLPTHIQTICLAKRPRTILRDVVVAATPSSESNGGNVYKVYVPDDMIALYGIFLDGRGVAYDIANSIINITTRFFCNGFTLRYYSVESILGNALFRSMYISYVEYMLSLTSNQQNKLLGARRAWDEIPPNV